MKTALRGLERAVNNMLARIVMTGLDTAKKCQMMQVEVMPGEPKDDVEHLESYGFTSAPLPGAEGFAVFPDGDRSHGVVLVVADRRYRVKGLKGGEVCLYTDEGDTLTFKRENTVELKTKIFNVLAEDSVNIDTKKFTLNASESATISTQIYNLSASTSATVKTLAYSLAATQSTAITTMTYTVKAGATAAITASATAAVTAPKIALNGDLSVSDVSGSGAGNAIIRGNLTLQGSQTTTGTSTALDHFSGGHSGATHTHPGDSGGRTGGPT